MREFPDRAAVVTGGAEEPVLGATSDELVQGECPIELEPMGLG